MPSITAGGGWRWGTCDEGRDHKGLAQRNLTTCKNGLTRVGSPLRTFELTPCVEKGASWPRTAEPMNLMSFTRCLQGAEFPEGGILTWKIWSLPKGVSGREKMPKPPPSWTVKSGQVRWAQEGGIQDG